MKLEVRMDSRLSESIRTLMSGIRDQLVDAYELKAMEPWKALSRIRRSNGNLKISYCSQMENLMYLNAIYLSTYLEVDTGRSNSGNVHPLTQ